MELSCGEELEELDRCRVRVRAAPVDILLPSALEVGPEGLLLPRPHTSFAVPCSTATQAGSARSLVPAQLSALVLQLCAAPPSSRASPALTGLCHPQIKLTRSSRSILVSDLPSLGIPEEALLDKLELFFSKTKNGGGEVEKREFLDDTGQVVLTFVEDGGAWGVLRSGHRQGESSSAVSGGHKSSPESGWVCVCGERGGQGELGCPVSSETVLVQVSRGWAVPALVAGPGA